MHTHLLSVALSCLPLKYSLLLYPHVLPVGLSEQSEGAEVGVNSLCLRLCPQQRFSH